MAEAHDHSHEHGHDPLPRARPTSTALLQTTPTTPSTHRVGIGQALHVTRTICMPNVRPGNDLPDIWHCAKGKRCDD